MQVPSRAFFHIPRISYFKGFSHLLNYSPMSLARNVLSNTVVQIIGKLGTALVSIVIIKLLTNYLGASGYGTYTTVYEFLTFFAIAADFGIFQIAIREMSASPKDETKIFGNILGLRLVLATAAMLLAAGSVWLIPKYTGTPIPVGVAICTLVTMATLLTGSLSSVLQVHLRMQWAVIGQIIGKVLSLLYMLLVIIFWLPQDPATGFSQLIVAGIVGNGIMLLLTYIAVARITPVSLRFDAAYWRTVLIKALPYGAALILATLYFRIDTLMLGWLRDQHEVGVYGVAMRIVENTQMIPAFFLNSILASLTAFLATNHAKFQKLFQYSFDALLMLAAPLVIGGWVIAYPLVSLVSSPEFLTQGGILGSDAIFRLLLTAMAFAFVSNLFGYTLLAANSQKKLLIVNAGAVLLKIAITIPLILSFGFMGAGMGSVVCELLVSLASGYFVWRATGTHPHFRTFGKVLIAAGIMGIVLYLTLQHIAHLGNLSLIILLPLGMLIYGGLLFALKAVTPAMLREILKKGGDREAPAAGEY